MLRSAAHGNSPIKRSAVALLVLFLCVVAFPFHAVAHIGHPTEDGKPTIAAEKGDPAHVDCPLCHHGAAGLYFCRAVKADFALTGENTRVMLSGAAAVDAAIGLGLYSRAPPYISC